MKTLRTQFLLLLAPLQLLAMLLRVHTGRLRAARAAGDRGALSIEMALIVMVVVAIAGGVLLALSNLGTAATSQVPTTIPGGLSGAK